jgi:hypothetical protein
MNDPTPRIWTEMLPLGVRSAITPGKRSISSCSIDRPGTRWISSSVSVEWGIALAGAGASAPAGRAAVP